MDKKLLKHYLLTGITLASIAGVSALAISLANLATKNRIALNEANKVQEGLKFLFGDNIDDDLSSVDVSDNNYSYVKNYYVVTENNNNIGYAFQTSGSNMYGKITMLVGISTTYEIGHIYMVTNEQTYATTLVDNYIDPYNEDSHDLDDVSCGATYGATLIKDMAKQAQNYAIDKLGGGQ